MKRLFVLYGYQLHSQEEDNDYMVTREVRAGISHKHDHTTM